MQKFHCILLLISLIWLNQFVHSTVYWHIFTVRCYASAVLAMGLCLSVCHKSVFCRNGWTNRGGFWHVSFLPPSFQLPSFYTVLKGNSVIFKNKGTSLWNFFLNSGVRKFCHGISIVETCYQLSLSKVDAQSMINWAVVGQLSRWYLWAPTLDHFSLSHRSSSAVYSTILSHGSISDSWYLVQDFSYK